ncbi:MAG: hypothetical protein LLF95_10625 [Bacteroidales bacterium]|nr:hypothetical protein [Bacteroidales bacterium]
MRKLSVFFILFLFVLPLRAQDSLMVQTDSINVSGEISLTDSSTVAGIVSEAPDSGRQILLPSHYLFTQRWLWGENGLMRKNDKFKLTLDAREREMEIRAKMNQIHRIAGYVSLAGMIGSGITGQMTYNGNNQAKSAHQIFTGLTNFSYFGSLALAVFSPPPMRDREAGFTKLNIHKMLAIVHVTSMLATNILSGMLEQNPSLVPYHRAAAITAFSTLFMATVVINL